MDGNFCGGVKASLNKDKNSGHGDMYLTQDRNPFSIGIFTLITKEKSY